MLSSFLRRVGIRAGDCYRCPTIHCPSPEKYTLSSQSMSVQYRRKTLARRRNSFNKVQRRVARGKIRENHYGKTRRRLPFRICKRNVPCVRSLSDKNVNYKKIRPLPEKRFFILCSEGFIKAICQVPSRPPESSSPSANG